MALIDDVKNELRVSGIDFDVDVQDLIDAAKKDLEESGVLNISETDKLTKMAIVVYCKAHFGWDNPEAERFIANYECIRTKLAIASDYNALKITFNVTHSDVPVRNAIITIDDNTITTNSLGVAEYLAYTKGIDIDYTVSYEGGLITGSVYVDADKAVSVVI